MDPKSILKQYFGYDNFRNNQENIISKAIQGESCLVLMPTGGGKSICYQIPALALPGTAVVVSPLISLMKDQVEALKANGIEAEALNSVNDFNEDTIIRRKCASGELKLLYISPEKLMTEIPYLLKHVKISLFAIDEAHCISQWGHDFRPEYAQLGILHQEFPQTPIMALTATADKITRNDIIRQLGIKGTNIFVSSFDRPNLSLAVKRGYTTKEKLGFIHNFILARPLESGIIYCLSRRNAESVATKLKEKGIGAAVYHAGLSNTERSRTQEMFKQDEVQVVCATIAFGMGIDKSNVRWVIHYNLPKSIENFYQEIGRAGRDGAPAETVLFYTLADVVQQSKFSRESGQKELNHDKLKWMQEYAESNVCRRRILLNYFGEQSDHDCGNCDICENPPKRFNGTRYVQMVLSAVKRTDEQARMSTVIEILKGMRSPTVMRKGYDKLKTFGVGKELSVNDWQDYILQMIQLGFLEIAYDEKNAVKTTLSGHEVLYGRKEVELCLPDRKSPAHAKPQKRLHLEIPAIKIPGLTPTAGTEDPKLFEALRSLRMRYAQEEGLPPYIVFTDKVLHSLATVRPTTLDAFGNISGIGEHKKKKYGEHFINVIKGYV